MKKVLGIAVLFLLVSFGNALAAQITLTGSTHGYATNYVTLNGVDEKVYGGEFAIKLDDWETYGYCIELTQSISTGKTNDYEVKDLSYTTGALEVAWLIDTYSSGLSNTVESAGLQLAVWKSIYGDDLAVKTYSQSYNDYLTYYSSLPSVFTDEIITDLEAKYDIVINPARQDLLVYNPVPEENNPVPEPSAVILLGTGLAGLYIFRKKKIV